MHKLLSLTTIQRRLFSEYGAERILSEENLSRTVTKFQAMPLIRMQTQNPARKAAVLIPLCVVDDKVSLLYTLRASHMRSHKGQVSFPGGMQDTKDLDLQSTALRETKEELGIDESRVKIWGIGNAIVARGETSVLPVIGTINGQLNISTLPINPDEVEQVFSVPIEELCQSDKFGYTQFKTGYSTPVYFGGAKRIWGLTAIITYTFLKCLVPTDMYKHKIRYISPVRKLNM